jgi:hypothetical protein
MNTELNTGSGVSAPAAATPSPATRSRITVARLFLDTPTTRNNQFTDNVERKHQ